MQEKYDNGLIVKKGGIVYIRNILNHLQVVHDVLPLHGGMTQD